MTRTSAVRQLNRGSDSVRYTKFDHQPLVNGSVKCGEQTSIEKWTIDIWWFHPWSLPSSLERWIFCPFPYSALRPYCHCSLLLLCFSCCASTFLLAAVQAETDLDSPYQTIFYKVFKKTKPLISNVNLPLPLKEPTSGNHSLV